MSTHEPPTDPRPVEVPPDGESAASPGLSPLVKIGIVFVVLGGAVSLLMFGAGPRDALVYSKLVHEVLSKPDEFKGRELRVEGELRQGSIKFREDPCEYRFTLGKDGQDMDVRFPKCIVPDTFKDGVGLQVSVEGQLTNEGYFLAHKVIAKCPSKYEMEERQKKGEKAPHGATPVAPSS